MFTNIEARNWAISQIERRLRSRDEPIAAKTLLDYGFTELEIIGALLFISGVKRANLKVKDGILLLCPIGWENA